MGQSGSRPAGVLLHLLPSTMLLSASALLDTPQQAQEIETLRLVGACRHSLTQTHNHPDTTPHMDSHAHWTEEQSGRGYPLFHMTLTSSHIHTQTYMTGKCPKTSRDTVIHSQTHTRICHPSRDSQVALCYAGSGLCACVRACVDTCTV